MRVHCEWGLAGVHALRDRVAALIVVDVLSFCTAVDIAVSRGAVVYPFPYGDATAAEVRAKRLGAVAASPDRAGDQVSLSPASLARLNAGDKILLPSPNGSRLSLEGGGAMTMAASLRNASAVAEHARQLVGGADVAVIPAGERWADGSLRPAIEDLLGAGAVIAALGGVCTAEAELARRAFMAAGGDVADLVADSLSGRELTGRGFARDVELAVEIDVSATVPLLVNAGYQRA